MYNVQGNILKIPLNKKIEDNDFNTLIFLAHDKYHICFDKMTMKWD